MPFIDKMKDSISEAGQEVSTRAKNASENARINNQIRSNEKKIGKLTEEVGSLCVDRHLDETDTEYEDLFEQIRELKETNQGLQQELAKVSDVKVCAQCGFSNKSTAKFCINCGAPLQSAEPKTPAGKKKCPNCGAVNDEDAVFCVECGTALPKEEAASEPEPESEPAPEPVPASETEAMEEALQNVAYEEPAQKPEEIYEQAAEAVEKEADSVEEQVVEADEEQQTQASGKYVCKNCGMVLEDDMKFCTNCGTKREE